VRHAADPVAGPCTELGTRDAAIACRGRPGKRWPATPAGPGTDAQAVGPCSHKPRSWAPARCRDDPIQGGGAACRDVAASFRQSVTVHIDRCQGVNERWTGPLRRRLHHSGGVNHPGLDVSPTSCRGSSQVTSAGGADGPRGAGRTMSPAAPTGREAAWVDGHRLTSSLSAGTLGVIYRGRGQGAWLGSIGRVGLMARAAGQHVRRLQERRRS
jgi:hypothetical protein